MDEPSNPKSLHVDKQKDLRHSDNFAMYLALNMHKINNEEVK